MIYSNIVPKQVFGLFLFASLVICSCEIQEGDGGTGKITGTLILHQYNDDFSIHIDKGPAVEVDVYIQYGTNMAVGDKVVTSMNGYFEFPYLFPGAYTVYYYSQDSLSTDILDHEVALNLTLQKGETRSLGELALLETLDFDDGLATIKGRVYEVIYSSVSQWPNLFPIDTIVAQEQEVYLTYNQHEFYDERIRTQDDGTFYFQHLIPGPYKVFLYSDDVRGGEQKEAIIRTVQITENASLVIDLGILLIHDL